jgi:hypothetical protein
VVARVRLPDQTVIVGQLHRSLFADGMLVLAFPGPLQRWDSYAIRSITTS